MTEEKKFLKDEGFGLDLATVIHTNQLEELLKKYKEKQLNIHIVISSFTDRLFTIVYDYETPLEERMEKIKVLLVNER